MCFFSKHLNIFYLNFLYNKSDFAESTYKYNDFLEKQSHIQKCG